MSRFFAENSSFLMPFVYVCCCVAVAFLPLVLNMEQWLWLYISLLFIYCVVVFSVALMVILENRQPVKTLAWVVVITCMPVLGLVLYAFFGRNIKRESLISRACAVQLIRRSVHRFYSLALPALPPDYEPLIFMFRNQSSSFPFADNTVHLFTDGKSLLQQLLNDIASASHHVHIEFFIFENDEVGCAVRDALIAKARQGVEVRLIYDDVGCWNVPGSFFREMSREGIQVSAFLPVRFPTLTSKVNYRNHRKIVVIDGQIGFVGGMNLANRYVHRVAQRPAWRDTHLRVQGSATLALQRAFLADWHVAHGETLSSSAYFPETFSFGSTDAVKGSVLSGRNVLMQVVTSFPMSRWPDIMQGLIMVLLRAKKYCYLQSPYFVPTEHFLFALQTAALAGVDVRLMIAERADKKLMTWASRSFLTAVMRAGVRVYLYRPTFLHSKLCVCDDAVCSCGTTNLDFRSFEHNFEINAFIYDKGMAQGVRNVFLHDQEQCTLLNLQAWSERSRMRRMGESFIRLFAPLL